MGLVALVKGADWLVEGASAFAKKKNVSDLTRGLTIVAFGTSAPELIINLVAAIEGHEDIVFGNVIGSNNINILLVLGVAGLISPLAVQSSTVWKEIPISLFAALLLLFVANDFSQSESFLSRTDGIVLLAFFSLFLYYVFRQSQKSISTEESYSSAMSTTKSWLLIIVGFTGLVVGGKLAVDSATDIATAIGISQKVIGLTIVALGTSLPELATSVVAAIKKKNDIAVGNIVGSNIFNIFLVLGASAALKPLAFNPSFNTEILLLLCATTILFVAMHVGGKKRLDRGEAAILLLIFIAYSSFIAWQSLNPV